MGISVPKISWDPLRARTRHEKQQPHFAWCSNCIGEKFHRSITTPALAKKNVTLLTHHLFAIGNILFYFFLWTVRAVCLTNISVVCVRSVISSRYCRGYNIKAEKLYRQLSTLQNINYCVRGGHKPARWPWPTSRLTEMEK